MTLEILRPNAPGDETSINQRSPNDPHWTTVDEVIADDVSTRVQNYAVESYQRDLYNLPPSGVGAGTINFIKIYIRCSYFSVQGYAKPSLKSNSTVTDGDEVAISTSWTAFSTSSQQWNTNPADSQPWEWSDINALQIGVSLKAGSTSAYAYCTQVYVEVDYTETPATPITRLWKVIWE